MKIHPVGAELFHVDRWTDRHDEANSCFSQFCEHAKKWSKIYKKGRDETGLCGSHQKIENYFCVPSHSTPLVAGRAWEVGEAV